MKKRIHRNFRRKIVFSFLKYFIPGEENEKQHESAFIGEYNSREMAAQILMETGNAVEIINARKEICYISVPQEEYWRLLKDFEIKNRRQVIQLPIV